MNRRTKTAMTLIGGLAAVCMGASATAAPASCPLTDPAALPRTVARQIRFGEEPVSYRVSVTRTVVRDAKGVPAANFVSTDYVADGSDRPVIFLYNGGPNLSATLIQFGGLGPRRFAAGTDRAGRLVDNPDSPLALADLVFVDPVGTGFSHALAPAKDEDFWGVEEDADSIAGFVTTWLKDHHRETAPVFLLGESYGGIRSIKVAHRLLTQADSVDLRGEILISGAIDFVQGTPQPGHDEAFVQSLPSMAAVAWSHGKADRAGRNFHSFLADAEAFAGGDYAHALFLGARLPAAERRRVAERMSSFIGIDADALVAAGLRPRTFSTDLLKADDKVLSFVDGREAVSKGQPEPFATELSAMGVGQSAFLRDELGVACADQYVGRARNKGWDWRFTYGSPNLLDTYLSGTGTLSRDLDKAKRLHAFLVGGYYDLNVPYFGTQYVVDHLGAQERVSIGIYEGGHAVYLDSETRTALGKDLREFVRRSLAD
jgi:carboxypeptidase C (cathepsin A)